MTTQLLEAIPELTSDRSPVLLGGRAISLVGPRPIIHYLPSGAAYGTAILKYTWDPNWGWQTRLRHDP